jgi:hypothetical protein
VCPPEALPPEPLWPPVVDPPLEPPLAVEPPLPPLPGSDAQLLTTRAAAQTAIDKDRASFMARIQPCQVVRAQTKKQGAARIHPVYATLFPVGGDNPVCDEMF